MKIFKSKAFYIICLSVLSAAIVAGTVVYFAVIRPRQEQEEWILLCWWSQRMKGLCLRQ